MRYFAYDDSPLPIGNGQTISQPYIVAYMTDLAEPKATDKALEIGTGCGYQAAVLSQVVNHLYSIEIVEPLAEQAKQTLERLGYPNISLRCGDGYEGWPEEAPFDIILLTAAPPKVPQTLFDQLKVGGRLVAPVGTWDQTIVRWTKLSDTEYKQEDFIPVRFVPMTGKAQGEEVRHRDNGDLEGADDDESKSSLRSLLSTMLGRKDH